MVKAAYLIKLSKIPIFVEKQYAKDFEKYKKESCDVETMSEYGDLHEEILENKFAVQKRDFSLYQNLSRK